MYYLAIDPGASAGVALITGPSSVIVVSCKDNIQDAYDILRKLDPTNVIVGLEKVHAIYGAAASSTFTFGTNYGKWVGILEYLGIPFRDVTVKQWQDAVTNSPAVPKTKGMLPKEKAKIKKIHKDTLKMESFRAATAAFPETRFPNHDVADAVNIARYLRLIHEKGGE